MARKRNAPSRPPQKSSRAQRVVEPKPTGTALIRPIGWHADWMDCLIHLHCELARLDLKPSDLTHYQREVFSELEGGISEEALSGLFNWWQYDVAKLFDRGKGYGRPAKPKIDVMMHFTSKNNLVVEWRPTGSIDNVPGPDCDWKHWYKTDAYFSERPSNELVFIRSLLEILNAVERACETDDDLKNIIEKWPEDLKTPNSFEELKKRRTEYFNQHVTTDTTLLQAAAGLIENLKRRLEHHFEVTMVNDIFCEWDEVKDEADPLRARRLLKKWAIENVADRTRREEAEELNDFPSQYGLSLETFIQALKDVGEPKGSGTPASQHTKDERATKALKKAGYNKITQSVVRRYRELLDRHRPGVFKAEATATIVPFKPSGR